MARSCAAWDDNNKDNVCKPNIPAGIKCPPPSKTISPITRFGANSTRLARGSWKVYGKVFGLQARDPVRRCFYIGGKLGGSKADKFESTAEERSVTTEGTAGVTGPGSGATRKERHRDRR